MVVFAIAGMWLAPVTANLQNGVSITPTIAYAQNQTEGVDCLSLKGVNLPECFANLIEYVIVWPLWYMASWAGMFSDIMLDMAISSETYSQNSGFVVEGWRLVRDITNIFFILTMLIIGIGTMLRIERISAKKLLPTLIIIALFINFSLFITKIVIDSGNILARAFITNINITVKDQDGAEIDTGYTQFSAAVMSALDPQVLINGEAMRQAEQDEAGITGKIVFLVGLAATFGIIVYAFIMIAFLFFGRILGLWFVMMLAPLAFISHALPFSLPEKFNHKFWWKNLFNFAFMPAIFLFFMYILIQFLGTGFVSSAFAPNPDRSFVETIVQMMVPIFITVGYILAALKVSKKMSGEIGEVMTKAGGAALGLAAAAATGGAALAARGTAGAVGSRIASSSSLKDAEAKGGWRGKLAGVARSGGKGLETSSFDWRQTGLGKNIMASSGMNVAGVGSLGAREGGIKGSRERFVRSQQEKAKDLEVGEDDKDMRELRDAEANLDEFNNKYKDVLDDLVDDVEKARKELQDAKDTPDEDKRRHELKVAKERHDAFKEGRVPATILANDASGNPIAGATDFAPDVNAGGTGADNFDRMNINGQNLKDIKRGLGDAKKKVTKINNERREDLAKNITGGVMAQVEKYTQGVTSGIVNMAAGAATGAAAGLATGSFNPITAAAGAVAGGLSGAATGAVGGYQAGVAASENKRSAAARKVRSGKEAPKPDKS